LARGKKRKYITTKRFIEPKYFDNGSGKVLRDANNSTKLNAYFNRQITRLDDIVIDLVNADHEPTFEKVVEALYRNKGNDDFISFAESQLRVERELLRDKTLLGYRGRISNLKKYRAEIPFNAIDLNFLVSYRHYLIIVKHRKANCCHQDFAAIKKILSPFSGSLVAFDDPFKNFKLKKEEIVKNRNTME
jgi:hypothetical protein